MSALVEKLREASASLEKAYAAISADYEMLKDAQKNIVHALAIADATAAILDHGNQTDVPDTEADGVVRCGRCGAVR